MTLLLWAAIFVFPYLLGKGIIRILDRKKGKTEETGRSGRAARTAQSLLTGGAACIGLAEMANLAGILAGLSFSASVLLFGSALFLFCLLFLIWELCYFRKVKGKLPESGEGKLSKAECLIFLLFGVSVLLQLILVFSGKIQDVSGDMTLETVNTFLKTDQIYQVNPLTGLPYETGMPMRLKILCLPFFYGALSSIFRLDPEQVVCHVLPAAVLLYSYLAYAWLGSVLFPESRLKKAVFLLFVSLVIWLGDYGTKTDAFLLLHGAFRGSAVRSGILLPVTICLCLEKKWKLLWIFLLAEACIVWTWYGLGLCFAATVFFAVLWLGRACLGKKR